MLAALRNDVRLQYRHGFYAAYAFVVVVYVLLMQLVPEAARGRLLTVIVLSEASVIGFFFAGALVLLERSDGTLQALSITPLRPREFLTARVASLTLLTFSAVVVVSAGAVGVRFNAVILACATLLTIALFGLLGTAAACRFATIDRFVVWGGLFSALLSLPVLPYFGLLESRLWLILPTTASLSLLDAAYGNRPTSPWLLTVTATWLASSGVLATRLASTWMKRYLLGAGST